MPKKQTADPIEKLEDAASPQETPVSLPVSLPVSEDAAVEAVVYLESEWKGLPRYQCPYCPFDTLHENVAIAHYHTVHAPPPPPAPARLIPVYDRWGNEVKPDVTPKKKEGE